MFYLQEIHDGGNGLLTDDDVCDVIDALHAVLTGPLLQGIPPHADVEGPTQEIALNEDGVHYCPDDWPELGQEVLAAGGVVRLGAEGLNDGDRLEVQALLAA